MKKIIISTSCLIISVLIYISTQSDTRAATKAPTPLPSRAKQKIKPAANHEEEQPSEPAQLLVGTDVLLHAKIISTASIDPNIYTPKGFTVAAAHEAYAVNHRTVTIGTTSCHVFVKFKKTNNQLKKFAIQAAQAVADNCAKMVAAAPATTPAPAAAGTPATPETPATPNDVRTIAEFKVIYTQDNFTEGMIQQFLQKGILVKGDEDGVTLPDYSGKCYVAAVFDNKITDNDKKEAGKQVFFTTADTVEEVVATGVPLLKPAS